MISFDAWLVRQYAGNNKKGRISKGMFQENKHVKSSEKRTFVYALIRTSPYCLIADEYIF